LSKKVSANIQTIMDHFEDYFNRQNSALREDIYSEVYEERSEEPYCLRQAEAYTRFLAEKNTRVYPFDLLAGQMQNYRMTLSQPLPEEYPEDYNPAEFHMGSRNSHINVQAEVDTVRPYLPPLSDDDEAALSMLVRGVKAGYFSHYEIGHVVTGFDNVIPVGWAELDRQIAVSLDDPDKTDEQRDTLKAMHISLRAIQRYFLRYAASAETAMEEAENNGQRKNLKRIADACRNLSGYPAGSFFEAVQFTVLLQEVVTLETKGSMSLGRIDQLWNPYYVADIAAGRITPQDAQDMVDAWHIKLAGTICSYQNVVIGGCDAQGRFAGNEVTRLILTSTQNIRYDQPLISLRYHKDMPGDLWEQILDTIQLGDGFPALFNDDVIIPACIKNGVAPEDAWDYSIVGCVETCIGGREYSNTEEMRINWCKVLEMMLYGGICPVTGERFDMREIIPLEDIKSYEQLFGWYKSELDFIIRRAAHACNLIDSAFHKRYPATVLSITIKDCIEKGESAGGLGPRYRYSTISNIGMANMADSLIAIRTMVFEKKMLTLTELRDALAANFKGYDWVASYAKNACEKYGNDKDEPDRLAAELVGYASDIIGNIANSRGFHFYPGYYGVMHHAIFGAMTGATPDGRQAGISLANALSPVQGADVSGPTATINSVTRCKATNWKDGMVLDMKFSPSFFTQPLHRKMFRALVQTYFEQGGMEIQFNVIGRETLLAAQREPEKYKNLVVRVSGFSAYFVSLFPELQNEIIARTEFSGIEA